MKILIHITVFLTLIGIVFSCTETKNIKNDSISDGLVLTAELGGTIYIDTSKIIHISTTISNPTLDTIEFLSWSCSYEHFFMTEDRSDYDIQSSFYCISNHPTTIILPPNQQTKRFIMVAKKDKTQYIHTGKLKVGMKYLKSDQWDDIFMAYENIEEAKIIWSNEMDLKELYRKVYEIPLSH